MVGVGAVITCVCGRLTLVVSVVVSVESVRSVVLVVAGSGSWFFGNPMAWYGDGSRLFAGFKVPRGGNEIWRMFEEVDDDDGVDG